MSESSGTPCPRCAERTEIEELDFKIGILEAIEESYKIDMSEAINALHAELSELLQG